jgi:TonB family protein
MYIIRLSFIYLMIAAFHICTAQGYNPSYDHSIAIMGLGEDHNSAGKITSVVVLPLPPYPAEMLRVHIIGEVTVHFLVREDGSVTNVTTGAESQKEFAEPVRDAVERWKFGPVVDRKTYAPTKAWMHCRIVFKIEEK